jgi:hypothetical protein
VGIADGAMVNSTAEMKYLCWAKLFTRLVLELPGFDESFMAIDGASM